ncbi:MAG: hypothetical protein N3G76_01440 [Candidatus Micrarchaeota archaeon]|nr:hypothetical protein [Candidatus Micrarchaeota archaeon]
MVLKQDYAAIIRKIEAGTPLDKDEKKIAKEAVERWLTENAVVANGIVSLVKLTADKDSFSKVCQVVKNARRRAEEGKEPLTQDDEKRLGEALAYLKRESSERIASSIKNGSVLFLSMLDNELSKIDKSEIDKLQKILRTIGKNNA